MFPGTTPIITNLSTLNNIHDDLFCIDAWSYDDKYFSAHSCTDMFGTKYVFNAITLKKIYETGAYMTDGSQWSPSSDSIVFSVPNEKVKLKYKGGEWDFTTDIVVYNADKLAQRIVLPANPEYIYYKLVWDNNGITATREYYADDSTNLVEKTDVLNIFQ